MEGIALTTDELVEVLSTYSALEQAIPAVASAPGWFVVGAFKLSSSVRAAIGLIASVSDESLTLTARIYDLTTLSSVGSVTLQSKTDQHVTSGGMNLVGGHLYQMQIQVVGGAGSLLFGSLKQMNLVPA